MRVCDAAVLVLRETKNPAVMWGDSGLLHLIADRAGIKRKQRSWQTENAVLAALTRQPGDLVPGKALGRGQREVRIFRLKAVLP